jgi:periplasmic divalent cation tolerance protein
VSDPTVFLVLCTVGDDQEAQRIAEALVQRQEAACVNAIPGVRSVFSWKGEICSEAEQLLLIKTTRMALEAVKRTVRELHSYELPEILAVPVGEGDGEYLRWVRRTVKGSP